MNIKKDEGITLIALIITVIVMLLLAFVAVSSINGFGLFGRVNNAVSSYNKSVEDEEGAIKNALGWLDGNGGGTITSPVIPPITEEPERGE